MWISEFADKKTPNNEVHLCIIIIIKVIIIDILISFMSDQQNC